LRPADRGERPISVPKRPGPRLRAILTGSLALLASPALAQGVLDRLDPVGVVLALLLLIFSLALHEVAHGWVALQCGDTTARDLGRLTLNPLPHVDPVMTVILPVVFYYSMGFFFGGAKPVPVAFHRLRHPWRDMMFVAIAGPFTNLLLAIFFFFLLAILLGQGMYERNQRLPEVLEAVVHFNILLAVFNLIPIPPLDGSRVMAWLLPAGMRNSYLAVERFGLVLIFGLIFLGPQLARYGLPDLNAWVFDGMRWVLRGIEGLAALVGIR